MCLFYASSRHCWTFSDIVRPLSEGQCCYGHIVGETILQRLASLLTSWPHVSLNCHPAISLVGSSFVRQGVFKAYPQGPLKKIFLPAVFWLIESVAQKKFSISFVRTEILTANQKPACHQFNPIRAEHLIQTKEAHQTDGTQVWPYGHICVAGTHSSWVSIPQFHTVLLLFKATTSKPSPHSFASLQNHHHTV